MEISGSSAEAGGGLPVTGTSWRTRTLLPVPADFVSLRLLLQPSGAAIEMTQPDILVGRHSQADVRLPLPDVSRRHCRFLFSEGVWQIIDLNSLNGVYLNGDSIRQATLRQGDLIRIGGFIFAVDMNGASPETAESEASEGLIRGIFRRRPDATPHRRSA
jgi:pSer/pThr/pTyr-binding forkhead associated (FHA) protein